MIVDLGQQVTQEQFGEMVGISQPAVSGLIDRGIIGRGEPVGQWVLDYCRNLREQAAGRDSEDGGGELVRERARLAREQADKIALQNAVTRGELGPVILLEQVLAKAAAKIAGTLDAITPGVRRRVPQLTADQLDLITAEVAKARNAVASMSLADLDETEEDKPESIDERITSELT